MAEPAPQPPDEADSLFAVPLDEFTEARNELARELKGSGDEELAERVQGLRKPTRAAWAINQAARAEPKLRDRLLKAAGELAAAQEQLLRNGEREGFDRARERLSEAVEALLAEAEAQLERGGGASAAMLDRARDTLEAAAGAEELRAELAAARVSHDWEPGALGGLEDAAAETADGERTPSAAEGRRLEKAERRLDAAQEELDATRERLERALERAEEARRELSDAETEVEKAEKRLEDAEEKAEAARDAVG